MTRPCFRRTGQQKPSSSLQKSPPKWYKVLLAIWRLRLESINNVRNKRKSSIFKEVG